jgi:prepilin-type N-terminal cleavage/methylation domain-containing protein
MNRGFTLIELGVALILVAGVVGISTGMIVTLRKSEQKTRVYTDDINGLRRAVRTIEMDLRAGRGDTCQLVEGKLMRGETLLASHIERFEVNREGTVWVARIGMKPRSRTGQVKTPVITLRVRPREQVR